MAIRDTPDAKAFSEQNRLLIEALRGADWQTPVPTCPGWTLEKLLRHVGRGDRWSAKIVEERAQAPVDHRSVADGTPPDGHEATLDWLRGATSLLFTAVDQAGADTPVWTFIGPKPASWWVRRRLHETLVHRADVAAALGRPYEVDPALAAESVAEFLEIAAVLTADNSATGGPAVRLQATDTSGSWELPQPGAYVVDRAAPATTVSASAADLVLLLTGRRTLTSPGIEVTGDPEPFERWAAGVNF